MVPDNDKYVEPIRAVESRFSTRFGDYSAVHADILGAYDLHMEESVPLPEDEKSISANPEVFERAINAAHEAFASTHSEFNAIQAECFEIQKRRGEELEQIISDFIAEGGDELAFRIIHEAVLNRRNLNAGSIFSPSP